MKLVFMGTPAFAVPALEALCASRHEVLAVITAPDKPRGRGRKTFPSEVKQKAVERDIPVLQPRKLKDPLFIAELKKYPADIFVVVAFRILPPEIYRLPPYGTINAHASLLPKYRGAAPIHWSIYHGEKESGVTVFRIERNIDTGKIIHQKRIPVHPDDTSGDLYEKLQELAAQTLTEALDILESGQTVLKPQDPALATPAPKIGSDDGRLDFRKKGEQLCREVRAFTPWPGAYFYLAGRRIKVLKADFQEVSHTEPGKITLLSKKQFAIQCADGYFLPLRLQSPGRRIMDVAAWMNGADLSAGMKAE